MLYALCYVALNYGFKINILCFCMLWLGYWYSVCNNNNSENTDAYF